MRKERIDGHIMYPLIKYPGYSITRHGQVWSDHSKKWLKPCEQKPGGYFQYCLSVNAVKHTCYMHRLIAETFITNLYDKPEVNHKNGKVQDNRIKNLEWVTSQENNLHAIETGLMGRKLEDDQVREIRHLWKWWCNQGKQQGLQSRLARQYSVDHAIIKGVIDGTYYSRVKQNRKVSNKEEK